MSPTPTLIRVDVVVAPVGSDKSFSGVAYVAVPPDFGAPVSISGMSAMAMAREIYHSESLGMRVAKDVMRDAVTAVAGNAVAPDYKNGRSGGVSVVEQIKTIMGRKSLGTQAILDALVKSGWQTNSARPKRMILHLLVTNSKGRNSTFKRVGRGEYCVR